VSWEGRDGKGDNKEKPSIVVQVCNSSTLEAEAGRSRVQGQYGLYSKTLAQKTWESQASMAHTYNPCYSGGRDQKDQSLNEASPGKQFTTLYLENTQNNKGLAQWLKQYSNCLASMKP
jgi:hypothetical protein